MGAEAPPDPRRDLCRLAEGDVYKKEIAGGSLTISVYSLGKDFDSSGDGYRWRKYGDKFVRNKVSEQGTHALARARVPPLPQRSQVSRADDDGHSVVNASRTATPFIRERITGALRRRGRT